MKHQNRIPTPIGQQIRRLRLTVVPFLVWLGAAAIAVYLWLSSPIASTFSGLVIGQETIVASPKDGLIEEVFVAPFEVVEAGQAIAMLSNASVDAQLLTAESELEGLRAAISSARAEIEREYEASQREANTDYELSISMARLELPAELRAFYDSENALELGILEKRLELAKSELKLADNRAQLERARASEEKKPPQQNLWVFGGSGSLPIAW